MKPVKPANSVFLELMERYFRGKIINGVKPWNPVPKKKHEPKAPSLIVNGARSYSTSWKKVKNKAKTIVNIPPNIAGFLWPEIKAWCEYVIVTPLDNNNQLYLTN